MISSALEAMEALGCFCRLLEASGRSGGFWRLVEASGGSWLVEYEFLQPRSSDRGLCNTADSPCCEQKAAVLLLGSVRKRSALRGVLSVVQVVQHCTVISVSLIGFGQDG